MCTQTQDVLKTFRMNIFLLFLLLFFRSAELWVHSSTAVGVSDYILEPALQNIRARPGEDVPDQHPLGDALEPADQPEQLNTLFLPGATAN